MQKKLQAWLISGLTVGVLAAATGAADAVDVPTNWRSPGNSGSESQGIPTIWIAVGTNSTSATRTSAAGTWGHKAEQHCWSGIYRSGPWRSGVGSPTVSSAPSCILYENTLRGRGWFRLP